MAAQQNSYKNLIVYQKAVNLSHEIIEYFSKFSLPKSKEFVVLQLLRAIASVGANIAEGYGRFYKKYYRQFLSIARGSSFESDYWLEIISRFEEFDREKIESFTNQNTELSKMLTTMMKQLQD